MIQILNQVFATVRTYQIGSRDDNEPHHIDHFWQYNNGAHVLNLSYIVLVYTLCHSGMRMCVQMKP